MRINYGFDDRQTQSGATLAAVRRYAIEAIKYSSMMIGINPDPIIFDRYKGGFAIRSDLNGDTASGWRVFYCVIDQIDQYLL